VELKMNGEEVAAYQMIAEMNSKNPIGKLAETIIQYQLDVNRTAPISLPSADFHIQMALGICKEAGEIAGIMDKVYCQGHNYSREGLQDEMGDLLFYYVALLNRAGIGLSDVIHYNMEKRKKLYPNGFSEEASRNRKR
jgi:NTP pyrophosphatase (non-canonical NTP hydrolase)